MIHVTFTPLKALFEKHLVEYLDRVTGLKITFSPCSLSKLPFFLRGRYDLTAGEFFGQKLLFFSPRSDFDDWTPSVIQNDRRQLEEISHLSPVFVNDRIPSNQRDRFIRLRLPFIVPGTQLYLPDLLMDLREHFVGERSSPGEKLSPSAQHLFLMAAEQRAGRFDNAQALAQKINYSAMTVGRAMDELEVAGLARIARSGKTKALIFGTENEPVQWRTLWERALPLLRSPARRAFPLYECPSYLTAPARLGGISALARYSMLSDPKIETWVVGSEWYRGNAVAFEGAEAPGPDWGNESLEIWSYDPGLSGTSESSWIRGEYATRGGIVDRLSLYLALRGSNDERVEQALEKMIGDITW